MSDGKSRKPDAAPAGAPETAAAAGEKTMALRLTPVRDSDQPIVANYTALNVAPGMVFIDFGFIEPAMLAALPRVARSGGKLPESINGRLAARVALGYDALAGLHQQLGSVLKGLSEAAARAGQKKSQSS
jgi:hypothetical protein